ncbi:hypothetical protein ACLB2K_030938 [Fragaria x ananassa]
MAHQINYHTTTPCRSPCKPNSYANSKCPLCGVLGHSKQHCFETIRYPDWWNFTLKPRKNQTKAVITIIEEDQPSNASNVAQSCMSGHSDVADFSFPARSPKTSNKIDLTGKLEKNGIAGEGKWSGTLLESSGVEARYHRCRRVENGGTSALEGPCGRPPLNGSVKCKRPSILHRSALTTARLHPSGHQRRPRLFSFPSEIDLKI